MKITVKLFASLQHGRFDIKQIDVKDKSNVDYICTLLKIPKKEKIIILVNGIHGERNTKLNSGDTVAIFPQIGGG